METISPEELERGVRAYEKFEGRDSMYRVATFLLTQWWGRHTEMVDALTVLLLTWNSAFYRYGMFDQTALERCLRDNWIVIEDFHLREIVSLAESDKKSLSVLFAHLLEALQIASGKSKGRKSPVAVAKALHLLAPAFLPIWDDRIATAYGCYYSIGDPSTAYVRFCKKIRKVAEGLGPLVPASDKTLLKRIDEYNYAKYTKGWV